MMRPGLQPSSSDIEVIFIVRVIDCKVNVMLWQRAAIISVLRLTAREIEGMPLLAFAALCFFFFFSLRRVMWVFCLKIQ